MLDCVRGGGVSLVRKSVSDVVVPRFDPSDLFPGPLDNPTSSEIVFHSPHPSQRPDHLLKDVPHDEHE
jgi:hypothetical protein